MFSTYFMQEAFNLHHTLLKLLPKEKTNERENIQQQQLTIKMFFKETQFFSNKINFS